LLVGRILLALVFLIAGNPQADGPAASAGYLAKLGFPAPEVMVWVAIAFELGGAVLLIARLEDALGGVGARAVHADCQLRRAPASGNQRRRSVRQPDEPLPEERGDHRRMLILAATGPGPHSVDGRRRSG
jgi:putative oxidoreductase